LGGGALLADDRCNIHAGGVRSQADGTKTGLKIRGALTHHPVRVILQKAAVMMDLGPDRVCDVESLGYYSKSIACRRSLVVCVAHF
jgi:hypothetical protein